jgi:hypothetical protein
MGIENTFEIGNEVRFRASAMSIFKHYLPGNCVGEVKAVYFSIFGISVRAELDIEFSIPGKSVIEFRKVPADQVEKV